MLLKLHLLGLVTEPREQDWPPSQQTCVPHLGITVTAEESAPPPPPMKRVSTAGDSCPWLLLRVCVRDSVQQEATGEEIRVTEKQLSSSAFLHVLG